MSVGMRNICVTRYTDVKTVMRRTTPIVSFACPKCRRNCDFDFILGDGTISYEILCPDCGVVRVDSYFAGGDDGFTVEGTGEKYNHMANLDDAKARAKAVEGDPMEEPIALAEAAWETYQCLTLQSLPAWKAAVDRFARCEGMDREHVRRMVPWILKFSGLLGDRKMSETTLEACRKVADLIGKPETAQECMLWMDMFSLECSIRALGPDDVVLPGMAKFAYQALSEQEKAECPEFPALWPLIMYNCSSEYWNMGGVDCDEDELCGYESGLWGEAVAETEKLLRSGHPMTPRIFRLMTDKAGTEMLDPCVHPVRDQLEALAGLSGDYADAFRAKIELCDVLESAWGDPVMPFLGTGSLSWTSESFGKLEDAIRKLERYRDPEIVGDMLTDAYFLLYKHDGDDEVKDNCTQMMKAMSDRHLEPGFKLYLSDSMFSAMGDQMRASAPAQNRAKPKGKSKKERVAEKRKAHIAKRKRS